MYDFSGGRVKRLLSLQCEHAVTSAAPHISAHTAFLLTGSHSGEVSVWQVDNGTLVTVRAIGSADWLANCFCSAKVPCLAIRALLLFPPAEPP